MRRILLLGFAIALSGCSGDDGDGGTPTASPTTTPGATDEPNVTREPSPMPAVVTCELTAAGIFTGSTQQPTGENIVECDLLVEPTNREEILPFKSFLVEMAWDEAQQTINEVGFAYEIGQEGVTSSGSVSTSPGGAGGTLMQDGGIDSLGSTDVLIERIFDGATSGWEAEVYVSLFELDAVPPGYSAL